MKSISESRRKIIYEELDYLESEGVIDQSKSEEIKSKYEVKHKYEFINIVILFSIALISIGIIGFATVNWHRIPDFAKTASLILLLVALLSSALYMEKRNPIASRVLYCFAMVEFAVSLYIIKDIMNILGEGNLLTQEMFIWTFGVTPLVLIKKDKAMNVLYSIGIVILTFIGGNGLFLFRSQSLFELIIGLAIILIFIAVNYYIVKKMDWDNISFIFANITMFVFLLVAANRLIFFDSIQYSVDETFFSGNLRRAVVYVPAFIFGILMERKLSMNKKSVSFSGNVFHFIAAFMFLTAIYSRWGYSGAGSGAVAIETVSLIVTGSLYIAYLMTKVKRGSTVNIIFAAIILVNIYSTLSSKYISRSLIFLGSGLILLLAALYIRKKGRIRLSEDESGDSLIVNRNGVAESGLDKLSDKDEINREKSERNE